MKLRFWSSKVKIIIKIPDCSFSKFLLFADIRSDFRDFSGELTNFWGRFAKFLGLFSTSLIFARTCRLIVYFPGLFGHCLILDLRFGPLWEFIVTFWDFMGIFRYFMSTFLDFPSSWGGGVPRFFRDFPVFPHTKSDQYTKNIFISMKFFPISPHVGR